MPTKYQAKRPGFTHTLSDYASYRGVDKNSISGAIKRGRLTEKSCYKTFHDNVWHIHPQLADLEWDGLPLPEDPSTLEPLLDVTRIPDPTDYPGLGESKAKREFYLAEMARLDLEEQERSLVSSEAAKKQLFDCARSVRESLISIPVRIVDEICSIPFEDKDRRHKILVLMELEINRALLGLTDGTAE